MVEAEKRFKVGACSASVFANEVNTSDGVKLLRTVSLQRVYKDRDGNWRYTGNFRVNDVPKAVLALRKAYDYVTSRVWEERGDKEE